MGKQGEIPILVVDDDPGALRSTEFLLRQNGFKTGAFSAPRDFLAAFDPNLPSVLILDFRMPELTGLEVFRETRIRGGYSPTLIVTAHGEIATCVDALRAGVADFLEKPVGEEILIVKTCAALEACRREVQRREMRKEARKRLDSLSRREAEILGMISEGKTMKEISQALGTSVQTVSKQRQNLLDKMRVDGDVDLVLCLLDFKEIGIHSMTKGDIEERTPPVSTGIPSA